MPEQALYLKWRPLAFDDMVGQEHITRTLRNALKTDRMRHAYLFSGPRGTGKTTTARLLAKAVNCKDPDPDQRPCNRCAACIAVNEGRYLDLIEIDAATHTGVDDVRELRDRIAFAPGEGRYKVYIIDEVHRFSGSAFDALLKTLEEPPAHALFVLATTEIDKVPDTIKSRCLQFEFRRLALNELVNRLAFICENEGLKIERGALEVIARQGTGSVRDSISLLDQIVSDPHEVITLELAQRVLGTANRRAVRELVEALVAHDAPRGLRVINQAVDTGSDPRQFGQQVVEYLRHVLLAQTASADLLEATEEDRALYTEQASRISRGALLAALRAFNAAVNEYRGGWQPQLALELALMDSLLHGGESGEPSTGAPTGQPAWAQPAPAAAVTPADLEAAVRRVLAQMGTPAALPAAPGTKALEGQSAETPADAAQSSAQKGAPPVIPLNTIKERWVDVQRAAKTYSPLLPALLDHAAVRAVEGNLVTLSVTQAIFRDKLMAGDNLKTLERAFAAVHRMALKVQVVLGEGGETSASARARIEDDPLLSLGLELGAQIEEE